MIGSPPPTPAGAPPTPAEYQARIASENGMLYTRLNYLFVLNGFAVVAAGMSQPGQSRLSLFLLAGVMVVLNATGAWAIVQTDRVIGALSRSFSELHPQHPLEMIVQGVLGGRAWLWCRPNRIFTWLFPTIITLGWLFGLCLLLGREF